MTDNIKPLFAGQPHPTEPNADVIQLLETMLADARGGGLRNIAIAGVYADGSVATATVCPSDAFAMLGALTHLQMRVDSCIAR